MKGITDEQFEAIKPAAELMKSKMDNLFTPEEIEYIKNNQKPEYKDRGVEFKETFAAADTNQDGLLDLAEYKDFQAKSYANGVARDGKAAEFTEAQLEFMYEHFNKANPDVDGLSMVDLALSIQAMMKLRV